MHKVRLIIFSLVLLVTLLGAFWRTVAIERFPVHLSHDEVTQLYDAMSIAQTGKDIYGNFRPFIFKSVNDYKSPFYTYVTALVYMFFGGEELTIRIPGLVFGILLIPAVFIFTHALTKSTGIALLASFLTAISPFEIFFSRKSFENGAGILLMVTGFMLLINFIKRRGTIWLYGGFVALAAAMYTYFSHAIVIPLLLLSFVFIFWRKLNLSPRQLMPVILVWFLMISPLLYNIVLNPDTRQRSKDVFIKQDINLGEKLRFLEGKSFASILGYKTLIDYSFNRYLSQLNPQYLFGFGLDLTNENAVNVGLLLLTTLPFLLLGVIYLIKKKNFSGEKKFILSWVLLGVLPSGLTFEPFSPHRSIMAFTMLNIVTAAGLYLFYINLNKLKLVVRGIVLSCIALLFIVNFLYFLHIYFVNFPYEKSQWIHYPFKQVSLYAWSQKDRVDQIIFDPVFGEAQPVIGTAAHYYLAYYGNYPPASMQKEYRPGFRPREVLFDKFSIRKVDWREDHSLKNVLIIASPWALPMDSLPKEKIEKTFYFYDNKAVAFYAIKL